jgi:DHA1 family tetracycline resistance protein-like MFS transporter
MKFDKIKLLVLFTVFIDVAGLGIVIPVLPFYVESFSGSAFTVSVLFAIYSLCSFISAPVIGTLSDKFGRRPTLLLSITSTAIGWFIFALAPSVLFLFIGRIVDGLAAGNLPVAQSALVDIAKDPKERTANLGLVGAVFGIAFIVGPFIGGALGGISHNLPFLFVGCLATANVIMAYFFLPETNKNIGKSKSKKLPLNLFNPFLPIKSALNNKILLPNYLALFLFGLAIAGTQSIFSLYVNKVFGFGEFSVGLIFALMGVIIAINQAFIMRKFWLKRFEEPALELIMLVIFALGYIFLSIPIFIFFVLGIIGMTFGQSVLRVVMNGQIVAKAKPALRGEVLGVSSSIISLSAGISPFVFGAIFIFNIYIPFILSALLLLVAFCVLYVIRKKEKLDLFFKMPLISEL